MRIEWPDLVNPENHGEGRAPYESFEQLADDLEDLWIEAMRGSPGAVASGELTEDQFKLLCQRVGRAQDAVSIIKQESRCD